MLITIFCPLTGLWILHVFCQGEEISSSPISFDAYDPQKAWLSGPQKGIVGEEVIFTGQHCHLLYYLLV
jgi:hypothetical protein